MINQIFTYVSMLLAGAAMAIVGSIGGYLGLATLIESLTKQPEQHILWGSISFGITVVGPVLVFFGVRTLLQGFIAASNIASKNVISGSSSVGDSYKNTN